MTLITKNLRPIKPYDLIINKLVRCLLGEQHGYYGHKVIIIFVRERC